MILSYRTRHNLRRTGKFLLIAAVIAAVVWVCWSIWVARYMYYDRDFGAKLDFNLSPIPEGSLAEKPTGGPGVNIFYNDATPEGPAPEVVKRNISGYFITLDELSDTAALIETLETLSPGTAVMLDIKSPKGYFYYTSDLEDASDSTNVSVEEINGLIEYLAGSDLYLIARLPAFRDWRYGLNHVPSGLAEKGKGGALWMDDTGCYWLDPTDEKALNYLVRITQELQSMGFDEVVYYDFRFPNTDKIIFEGDKTQAITEAAVTLATACATQQLCVSFEANSPTFALPQGNCRVYLRGVDAEDAESVAQQVATDDPTLHVLFITTASDASDTRFEKYSVLRPMESAH